MQLLPFLCLALAEPPTFDPLQVLSAPYSTPDQVQTAWKPATDRIEWLLHRQKPGFDAWKLLDSVYRSDFWKYSVIPSYLDLRADRPSVLYSMTITNRTGEPKRSRSMSVIFFWRGRFLKHQFLGDRELLFGHGRLVFGDGAILGQYAYLTGTTWGGEPCPGRAAATVLRWDNGKWTMIAKRSCKESGKCVVEEVPRRVPDVVARYYQSAGPAITYFEGSPALEFEQHWRVTPSGFVPRPIRRLKNRFWALEGLVDALRRGSDAEATRFCSSPALVGDAKRAGLATPGVKWKANDETSDDIRGLQLGAIIEGASVSMSVRFRQVGDQARLESIKPYTLPPR